LNQVESLSDVVPPLFALSFCQGVDMGRRSMIASVKSAALIGLDFWPAMQTKLSKIDEGSRWFEKIRWLGYS